MKYLLYYMLIGNILGVMAYLADDKVKDIVNRSPWVIITWSLLWLPSLLIRK
jgi:hypothetical protein